MHSLQEIQDYTPAVCVFPNHMKPTCILRESSHETPSRQSGHVWRQNLHQSTSLAEVQKALEVHSHQLSVANLSIAPHTLRIPTANVTCCIKFFGIINESQVNMHVV